MAETHRPKLFKARFKRWGFSKYITTKVEREALQHADLGSLQRERAVGPDVIRLSNGTMISLSSLVTHFRRKRSSAPPYPMPVPCSLRSPDDLWISEKMLGNACEYIRTEHTHGPYSDHDIRAILPLHYADFCRGLEAVRSLLQEARVDDALLVLQRRPRQSAPWTG